MNKVYFQNPVYTFIEYWELKTPLFSWQISWTLLMSVWVFSFISSDTTQKLNKPVKGLHALSVFNILEEYFEDRDIVTEMLLLPFDFKDNWRTNKSFTKLKQNRHNRAYHTDKKFNKERWQNVTSLTFMTRWWVEWPRSVNISKVSCINHAFYSVVPVEQSII